jgi:hypothetical protein
MRSHSCIVEERDIQEGIIRKYPLVSGLVVIKKPAYAVLGDAGMDRGYFVGVKYIIEREDEQPLLQFDTDFIALFVKYHG